MDTKAAAFFPTSRGLFSVVFDELMGARKRDLCPRLKRTLIQPPSLVVDVACKTYAPFIVAGPDLSPLTLAHLFTITLLSFSEPAKLGC